MANTYTRIYIQIVFAVEGRQNVIRKEHRDEIYKYISGIIQKKGHKLIAINGMADHVHVLIGMKPDIALSDLVRDMKAYSSRFINRKDWMRGKFNWQEGFGAFSYSYSQLHTVANYIENQEEHHSRRTFRDEYLEMLKKFDVEYDTKYVFSWIENES
ncbi:IS200/IS605 family transposase [Candidatus Poribacteria bacterium]